MAKQTKKGDTTPNQLFSGIVLFPGNEGAVYHETGQQYDVLEGFEQMEDTAETVLIERLQIAAATTKGTDHNTVFRIAGLLNYVAKKFYLHVFRRENDAGFEYHVPLEGGYLAWEEAK
jgi:hypothetical protein